MPEDENSEHVADVIYQKEPIWNVYQEATYKLTKRLRGITSVWFVLNNKVHIKGFYFKKINRDFEKNPAAYCDSIYGDSYIIKENRIEGIGNNVSITFENMDFSDVGASKLIICGRSPIANNTIHIRISDDNDESSQLIEFTHSEGYEERSFDLERIRGIKRVTFIFLPGSEFDLAWFRFER